MHSMAQPVKITDALLLLQTSAVCDCVVKYIDNSQCIHGQVKANVDTPFSQRFIIHHTCTRNSCIAHHQRTTACTSNTLTMFKPAHRPHIDVYTELKLAVPNTRRLRRLRLDLSSVRDKINVVKDCTTQTNCDQYYARA